MRNTNPYSQLLLGAIDACNLKPAFSVNGRCQAPSKAVLPSLQGQPFASGYAHETYN